MHARVQVPGSGSRLQAPGSRLQAPGSRLQAPGSRLQAPGSRLDRIARWLLVSCALAAACGDATVEKSSVRGSGARSAALSQAEACAELFKLKQAHSIQAVHADDALLETYRVLLAECSGQDPDAYRQVVSGLLESDTALASALSADQQEAWKELGIASRGLTDGQWNEARRAPAWVQFEIGVPGADAAAARAEFDARLGQWMTRLFGKSQADSLELVEEQVHDSGDFETTESARVARYVYRRRVHGLPVFGNVLDLTLRRDHADGKWQAFVAARWARDAASVGTAPAIAEADAVTAALASGEVPEGSVVGAPELGVCDTGGSPAVCYRVTLANADGRNWTYSVSAADSGILDKGNNVSHYDGTLYAHVGRPHEENNKYARPVPRATIYEDPAAYSEAPGCGYTTTMNRTRGDAMRILGSTTYSGTYSSLVGIDPGDTSWDIDLRGQYVLDTSPETVLALGGFTAGGGHTFPQSTTYHRSRRGEVFYLLNYGAENYRLSNITQYEPLKFLLDIWDGSGEEYCQTPETWQHVKSCVYAATANNLGCVNFETANIGAAAHPVVERYFRQSIAHEQNHSVFYIVQTGSCGDPECLPADEGRADFGALIVNQFEAGRDTYRPGLKYPNDLVGNQWQQGQVWTAIYSHLAKQVGIGMIHRVHRYLNLVTGSTRMVGTCSDSNSDGFVDPFTECPSNSFFRHLLAADVNGYSSWEQIRYEISKTFREHVTDADPDTTGIQTVPWADELPNRYVSPPFVGIEFGSAVTVSSGPDAGALAVGFQYPGDYDALIFFGRAGESYLIETENLASGVDTVLTVLDSLSGAMLAGNDDCPGTGSLRSCITFTPTATKYYVVRAYPYSSNSTGPGKTYRFKLQMMNDDVGDDRNEAMAFVANNGQITRTLNSSTDVDVYRVSAGGSETMSYRGCSDSGFSVKVEVLNAGGTVVGSHTASSCASSDGAVSVTRGTWFLRVTSPTGATGAYKLRALLTSDIDAGDNPWVLTQDHTGRVIASRFESSTDEDWFSYTASAGRRIIVETFAGTATEIEVYAPATTVYGRQGTIDSLPDTSGKGYGHWMLRNTGGAIASGGARVVFVAPVSGTYRVRLRSTSQVTAAYYLMFNDTGINGGWYPMP
jgi:hypothetical protein